MSARSVLWAMGDLADDEATLREADEHATRWLADPTSVDADTASVALSLATRHAGPDRLSALQAMAREGKTREDRILALKALPAFDDPAMLRKALDMLLGEQIRPHDTHYVLGAAYGRRQARVVTEAWVREHWGELRKKLPGSLSAGLVSAVGVGCTKAELDERTTFYTPRAAEIEGAARPFAEAMEGASLCVALRAHGAETFTRELLNAEAKKTK